MIRAHGVRGEVVVYLSTNREERMQSGSTLYGLRRDDGSQNTQHAPPARHGRIAIDTALAFAENDLAGMGDPLVVSTSRFLRDKWPGTMWIVKFKGVDTRNEALQLRGIQLAAPPIDDNGAFWADQLVGSVVMDLKGNEVGRVSALVVNPGGDLLELDDGRLIPLVFVVSNDGVRVVVDVPEGLL